jgi:hypothetical protein
MSASILLYGDLIPASELPDDVLVYINSFQLFSIKSMTSTKMIMDEDHAKIVGNITLFGAVSRRALALSGKC